MTEQQVRLYLKRLAAEGRFTQEGRGRTARLPATADPTKTIAPDVEYVRDRAGRVLRQRHRARPPADP